MSAAARVLHDSVATEWDAAAAAFASPFYQAVRPLLESLNQFPDVAELNTLAGRQSRRATNAEGKSLQFVLPKTRIQAAAPGLRVADNHYEMCIHCEACVETRECNWHDCFNALSWLTWPRAKAALNTAHVRELQIDDIPAARRSGARDAATLFDEGGAVLACSDDSLSDLLRGFHWRQLFCTRRADVIAHMRCYIFGHALLDKARAPYKAMTAHALIFPVPRDFLTQPAAQQVERLDLMLAERIGVPSNLGNTHRLAPLPLLGFPGFCPENAAPAYYDDASVFRPGRLRVAR